ncbi:MAG: FkbM family methyltransferase [Pedobacter sp.]
MVENTDVVEVRFNQPPDSNTAIRLLHEICSKKPVYSPRIVNKPLILYGAGKLGRMAKEYFQSIGIPVLFVVDAKPDQYADDLFWENIDILKPDDVSVEYKQDALLAVCVATTPFTALQSFLYSDGWLDFVPFYDITEAYRNLHPLRNGWFSGELDNNDIAGIEAVLCGWSEDISRAHHLQFIAWHYLREEWFFEGAPVTTTDRYFIPQIVSSLHHNEIFLDLGAHHGDTTTKFLQLVNNQFAAIWIIEPDVHNLHCLEEKLKTKWLDVDNSKIHILSCAVGNSSCDRLFLDGLGYASQFCDFAQTTVEVKTIDELNIVEPTFIKMHLEGEDYNAFKGGIKTIQNSRPIIVATTYHNRLGIWQFPDLLMKTLTKYMFFLRQHSWSDTGSVLYAIPKERYVKDQGK